MAKSTILAINQIAENQNNKYLTHNDAINALEASTNDIYVNAAVGAGPVALTEAQSTAYHVYRVSGGSAAFDVDFQATINGNNAKRVFAVHNADTTYAATVEASTGSGAVVVVQPGSTAIIYQSYQDMYALASNVISGLPYDVGAFIPEQPADGVEVFKFVATRPVSFPDDFAGSVGHCGVVPTSTAVFTITKNGATIGTISINTSGVLTFVTTGGGTDLVAGDRLAMSSPSPQDATLADVAFTFKGTR